MKLYRAITNHDRVPEGIYTRTFRQFDTDHRVTLTAQTTLDPVIVTWRFPDGKTEEHHLSPQRLENIEVQRHVKAEEGNKFDVSERKTVTASFAQIMPCDLVMIDTLRQD